MMTNHTDNLKVGSVAPAFTLSAANRAEKFSLSELILRGPLVIEFTRGTW
jgi:peroxiredoxin